MPRFDPGSGEVLILVLMRHGHTHSFFDYQINNTRILCNPLGYPGETTGFTPDLQVVL